MSITNSTPDTTEHSPRRQRRINWAALALLGIGVTFAPIALHLVFRDGIHPAVLIPSIVTIALGAQNLTQITVISTGDLDD